MESCQSIALSSNIQQICWKRGANIQGTEQWNRLLLELLTVRKLKTCLTLATLCFYGKVESKVDRQKEIHDRVHSDNLEKGIVGTFKIIDTVLDRRQYLQESKFGFIH